MRSEKFDPCARCGVPAVTNNFDGLRLGHDFYKFVETIWSAAGPGRSWRTRSGHLEPGQYQPQTLGNETIKTHNNQLFHEKHFWSNNKIFNLMFFSETVAKNFASVSLSTRRCYLILHHNNTDGCSHFARNFATDLHKSGLLRVLRGAVFSWLGPGRDTRRGSGVAFWADPGPYRASLVTITHF